MSGCCPIPVRQSRQPVTTGEETAEMTQILSGITAEDIVLIGENLQSGQPVRLEGYYEG